MQRAPSSGRTQPFPLKRHDGNPVNLIFVLLVPEKATDQHLQILSELAQMFSERSIRSALNDAADADTAQRVIVEWEPHAPDQRRAAI